VLTDPIADMLARIRNANKALHEKVEMPAPLNVANVMIVCPVCNRATRVGYEFRTIKGEQVKVRVCKRVDCGQELDRERK